MEDWVFGFIIGSIVIFPVVAYMTISDAEENPRYYGKYNEHKQECEASLPRDQECYVEYVWKIKEVE